MCRDREACDVWEGVCEMCVRMCDVWEGMIV